MSALILGAAVIGGGAMVGSSMIGSSAASDATSANMGEAERNRQFQERMSSTAYQRQMADMQKAGLNPMLAMGGGGASSPSGSTGSAVMDPSGQMIGEGISRVASSALEARRLKKELDQTDSMIKLQDAQAEKAKSEEKLTKVSAKNMALQTPAVAAESQTRKVTAEWDKWAAGYDAFADRIGGALNTFGSALGRVFKPGPGGGAKAPGGAGGTQRTYRNSGLKRGGTPVPYK